MFTQIFLKDEYRNFHKILWRNDFNEEYKIYALCTVKYGSANAPFLAVRSLIELANRSISKFVKASDIIKRDFYMDDILTECDSKEELIRLKQEVSENMKLGRFELHRKIHLFMQLCLI